ncbi:hypothetical protein AGLY_013186 [Aphis glycines]|uniref:Uncharacterized protein n=1 Tax=Aphis glycines TaxID=307491 RepID=A0A6G0T5K6_APHGL|nr:hypothetical protein AGLY_013186 [Aphis glycines]
MILTEFLSIFEIQMLIKKIVPKYSYNCGITIRLTYEEVKNIIAIYDNKTDLDRRLFVHFTKKNKHKTKEDLLCLMICDIINNGVHIHVHNRVRSHVHNPDCPHSIHLDGHIHCCSRIHRCSHNHRILALLTSSETDSNTYSIAASVIIIASSVTTVASVISTIISTSITTTITTTITTVKSDKS